MDNEFIRFAMGVGLIKGKYKLSEVEYCKTLRYIPFGWG